MRLLPRALQGASYGLFAVSGAIGLSGFDLWQTWLLAAVALAWVVMQLAGRLPALFVAAGRVEKRLYLQQELDTLDK